MSVYVCNIVVISKTRSNRFHKHHYFENWIWRVNLILGWLELESVAFCVLDGLSMTASHVPWRNMIWATVNIWYVAPSHQFLKSVYRFLKSECIIVFQAINFQKRKMSRILLSINMLLIESSIPPEPASHAQVVRGLLSV